MNDKSHACDCPADMPTQQCIRYCTGECDGPSDTPAGATPHEPNAKSDDGIAGAVTVYGNWGKLICHPETGNVLSYDRTDSDSECDTDGYANIIAIDVSTYRKQYGTVHPSIDIINIGYWIEGHRYEPPLFLGSETVGERLKRIYPEHYVTIITRMNAERGPQATAIVLSTPADDYVYSGATLSAVFLWARTPEGSEFWKALAKREQS